MSETPGYKVGDVVNGHRLGTDGQWHPVEWKPPPDLMKFETVERAGEPASKGSPVVKIVAIVAALIGLMIIVGAILVATGNGPDEAQPVTRPTPTVVPSISSSDTQRDIALVAMKAVWANMTVKERQDICIGWAIAPDVILEAFLSELGSGTVTREDGEWAFRTVVEDNCG
jgi:hypothetical protein